MFVPPVMATLFVTVSISLGTAVSMAPSTPGGMLNLVPLSVAIVFIFCAARNY